ncbi:hypothetical protein [Emcibacter nanhaiensis]|uniref:Uncharacterized protein n=1 Tax=Emcibacter nanhaiensis TaxID=1505037 RepID=A0A501PPI7_9PROT|nr:hypothetical protein [Emcibacter nanhaiensis]TPD62012.1 hypothetical protein FIV46_07375 [Emcibacter nanhaiensis]
MKEILKATPNPDKQREYVIELHKTLDFESESFGITLKYVADKLILAHSSFDDYLDQCQVQEWNTPEGLASNILEDCMDILVPKWIRVQIFCMDEDSGLQANIYIEDRQPNWNDDALVSRSY